MNKQEYLEKLITECHNDMAYHHRKLNEYKFRVGLYEKQLDVLNNE